MQTGSGYGAFNFLTPSEALGDAAAAQQKVTQSQLASAVLPDQVANSRTARGASELALADAKTASQAKTKATHEALIANAASLAETAEDWDAAMQSLADQGVGEARQFIGRYSTQLQGRVASAYSAASPSSALEAMTSDSPTGTGAAQSGLASVAGGAGAGVSEGVAANNFDQLYAKATPDQVKAAYGHLEKMRDAIDAVGKAQNPATEWDRQVVALGHPEWRGQYSAQKLQQLAQEVVPHDNYLRGRVAREGAGVPGPKIAAKVDNVGGTLYAVDESDPANPTAKPLTPQGKGTFVGLDKDGHGIYYDPVTQKETHGSEVINAPRYGGGGRNTVFAMKQAAWLAAHPGDVQGALDYAGSLKGKAMTPQQVQASALSLASRELADLSMAGTPPPDGQAFLTERAGQIANQLTQAGIPGAGGAAPAPAGPIPQRALALLKDGKPHRFNNGQTWQMKGGKPVQVQ